MVQYNRQYKIQIFSSGGVKILESSELRVVFDINKSLASTPNKASVSVYGLSDNTRNNLRASYNRIILNAGYPENSDVIFDGQSTDLAVTKTTGDIITKITAGDGAKGQKFGTVGLTIRGGTSINEVIEKLADTMPDVKAGILKGLEGKAIPENGMTFTGSTKIVLDEAGKTFGFSWSIQDGILETVAEKKGAQGSAIADSGKTAYVISSSAGMIGIPVVKDNEQVSVKALLNPRIKPGRIVKIETQAAVGSGFYKVSETTFKGDTRGNDWYINIIGVPLKV